MQIDYSDFQQAMAQLDGSLNPVSEQLSKLAQEVVGHKLFTLTIVDRDAGEAGRIYSNMPDAYPISGKKPVTESIWTEHVLGQHKTFVANTIEEIAEVFEDYELIRSLGCESVINIPVVMFGNVLGTINCLAEKDHYTSGHIEASECLKLPGAVCFLSQLVNQNSQGVR